MPNLTILIPTYNRPAALAVTLTSLASQSDCDFDIIISDQSEAAVEAAPLVQAAARVLRLHGPRVSFRRHLPRRGIAEQRAYLLGEVDTPHCLYLDDDLLLETYVIDLLRRTLQQEGCGFVGAAPIGLSFLDDVRPHHQAVEFWDGPVRPERVVPDSPAWHRAPIHSAANLWHAQQKHGVTPEHPRTYKVAWVGGCVMYDTERLRQVGGFDFWRELPPKHCGEEVFVQLRLMDCCGGCGLMPSGVYHQELPTTLPDRSLNIPEAWAERLFDPINTAA